MRWFSDRQRPVHLGPYPHERLPRGDASDHKAALAPMQALRFDAADPNSLSHAMARFIGMFDVVRDGVVSALPAEITDDPLERTQHLKAAAYFFDASAAGTCVLTPAHLLVEPIRNPLTTALADELEASQPRSFAAGIDAILVDVIASARSEPGPLLGHGHALVIAVEYQRDLGPDEPGVEWLAGTQAQRAATLAAQTAVMLASYLRLLGASARSHTATCSDVDLGQLALSAGLGWVDATGAQPVLHNPFMGRRFGLAAVTTSMALAHDLPLRQAGADQVLRSAAWRWGKGTGRSARNRDPYAKRAFHLGAHPFERLTRQQTPTTFIDGARVPRFPKRADFFARALFGDLGDDVQDAAKNARYVMKSPIGACARRALGALLLLQFGEARGPVIAGNDDAARNALRVKAMAYYLGCDAVGLCAIPTWAYYSHDAGGQPMPAYHPYAVNMLLDQGHETMEGASGDDWISVAQSMRAYLRFSLIGGVVAEQLRRQGFSARVHSVLDGDLLQPPLLLLSGLGEVSRIGEVILNPYLGPRLKSGVVSTDMEMAGDLPIDFGLQRFCESCNKCARECPSGAITAGPKKMVNGYEIWKSDAEKCARYRITNAGGGMCGRCMKTCPWNLEGLFAERGVRWLAMKLPASAPLLARLDDAFGRGEINPVKTWWWNIELNADATRYVRAAHTHRRALQPTIRLKAAEQALAVYPADVLPPPYPVRYPVDRPQAIQRYRDLLSADAYRERLTAGDTTNLAPAFRLPPGPPPVFPLILTRRDELGLDVARYELKREDGVELPAFDAGAHVDLVIAPEYLRAFSLAGDPADRSRYVLGVQREPDGRGGSQLMHRAFRAGRRVFVSPPRNHFALDEGEHTSLLIGGGIGVTPLIAMAHRLHTLDRDFALHYCVSERSQAAFEAELASHPWHARARLHVSAQGSRADLDALLANLAPGSHVYTCGSARLMDAVFEAARRRGLSETALHSEYFSVPTAPPRVNHAFELRLARSGRVIPVGADESATQALARAGVQVTTKCSDGLCGVCVTRFLSGEVEHRDLVLDAVQRQTQLMLCCSRAAKPAAVLEIDL